MIKGVEAYGASSQRLLRSAAEGEGLAYDMRMRRLRRRGRARPQRRRQVDVPLLEREVEFGQGALARCKWDAGLKGVDGREEAGGDLHELAGGMGGGGAVCEGTRLAPAAHAPPR